MTEQVKQTLIKEKPAKIILEIWRINNGKKLTSNTDEEVYAQKLARNVDTTYSHAIQILGRLEEGEMITTDKHGRKKIIELTDEGEKVAEALNQLLVTIQGEHQN